MEVASAVLFLIVILAPSLKKLIDSVAYRNKACGRAEVIRAQRGTEPRSRRVSEGGRDDG
ncbi:hypothetical protein [Streptomyces sp. NBC_00989]|uniref:hypothetical protein n=1 Tax=Streptomyces sp. NBC_00989 TaxID=2903705 RepID=UPI003865CE28|nr:hypothetical protein OG714_47675 [Streptomyces sp. NBC_00989]